MDVFEGTFEKAKSALFLRKHNILFVSICMMLDLIFLRKLLFKYTL